MKKHITRRDFLKLARLIPMSLMIPPNLDSSFSAQKAPQNVLIIVFDALSARNVSLYGYQRETMPNLHRLADRAVVYHRHYAGGNFTTPGTASLLTGVYPWKHRAFHQLGIVDKSFINKSIFHFFPDYHRITFTHNPYASAILDQFIPDIERYIPKNKLLITDDFFIPRLFKNDEDIARVSWIRAIKKREDGYAYSLLLSHIYEHFRDVPVAQISSKYPRGLPNIYKDNYFLLEHAIDRLTDELRTLSQPFLGYFHFWPPHDPYNTRIDFYGRFQDDGLKFIHKPSSRFSRRKVTNAAANQYRIEYDEFILYADREFGRLMDYLERYDLLENTWVVLTSDHGEMFERGIVGHSTSSLYEPIIQVPLIIFEPGRKTRKDVFAPTSAVDLLPTLLHVTGHGKSDWAEGIILPPYNSAYFNRTRPIYIMDAEENGKYDPLTVATAALVEDHHKLVYFFGYDILGGVGNEFIELYDVYNDPEELVNLFPTKKSLGLELLENLKQKLLVENEPYQ